MGCIRLGIELTAEELQRDLMNHPERYFSIMVVDGRAALCVQTCDSKGENTMDHMIDGCVLDSSGSLKSIFEKELRNAFEEKLDPMDSIDSDHVHYRISPTLIERIREETEFINWLVSRVQTEDRHLYFVTRDGLTA